MQVCMSKAVLISAYFPQTRLAAFSEANARRAAPFGGFQPEEELYACADRIKTPALGEVFSSLVPLRFYPSESASAQAYNSSPGVNRRNPPTPLLSRHNKTAPKAFTSFGAVIMYNARKHSACAFPLFFSLPPVCFRESPAGQLLRTRRLCYA